MLTTLQQQFLTYWKKQSLGRQITLAALTLSALILIPTLVSWANMPSYSVAYSGLSEEDAAQIVQKLDENNIAYQLKSSGTIEVQSDQVYSTRLLMAREGLPQSSTVGYELFSGSSMLGMTEFTQKVNYQRAVEGELERTIGSLEAVEAVRVHLVIPEKSLLTSQQTIATASVTVQVAPGETLDDSQVRAVTHLVASSVEGLQPENVVVVDSEGNLLASGSDSEMSMNLSDTQRAVEKAYALEVQKRVQTLLDKILGPNRSVVQASVEMDWTQREVTSNTYQPTETALRSSQIINESSASGGAAGGVPGAASNLPTPVATTTGTEGESYQRSEETLNFEISQVQSHEIIAPGQVSRISVSVMVDGVTDTAQMDIIKSAVQVAAGIDSTRGDQIVVESFDFDRTALDALSEELAAQQQQELYLRIALGVAAALVVLAVFFIIIRMINNTRNASKDAWKSVMLPVGQMAALPGDTDYKLAAMKLQDDLSLALARLADKENSAGGKPVSVSSPIPASAAAAVVTEDMMLQIRNSREQAAKVHEDEQNARVISRLTEENPATVAEIIQIWLNEGKK
jgi:flagellar M-ring protein FliF